ncbi:MAG: uracil-DNA glycosylase [Ignavibacteriales bacterium]|nr:uracil-DNA glycosylase [Ignavibacteriales bacterium]
MTDLQRLQNEVIRCTKCPRLVRWRTRVAREKVRRFEEWDYWGKPVPGFGDPAARLVLVGLAPAAHGANRTGRMFTGDRSGDWLYRALYKAGFASQPDSLSNEDGLQLRDCYITATCRCAPPLNKLLPAEVQNCRPFLLREFQLLKNMTVVVGLGRIGFEAVLRSFRELGWTSHRKEEFSHGAEYQLTKTVTLLGSFHPSQQNTFTGKLTEPMFDSVFRRVQTILKQHA